MALQPKASMAVFVACLAAKAALGCCDQDTANFTLLAEPELTTFALFDIFEHPENKTNAEKNVTIHIQQKTDFFMSCLPSHKVIAR